MKKIFLLLAVALVALSACGPEPKPVEPVGEVKTQELDATSHSTWHYFSLKDNAFVGTGEETEEANAEWFKRTDWDLAICRYQVRTNSGAATTVEAKGGVYTFAENLNFDDIVTLPENIEFVVDTPVTEQGHMGETTTIKSTASVIAFKLDDNGMPIMPPQYLQTPTYLFKTADGNGQYKLLFTGYKNPEGTSGHVTFKFAEMNK